MKAAIIHYAGTSTPVALLPDHTVKDATPDMLKFFLLHFRNLDENPQFKGGTGHWSEEDPLMRRVITYAYVTNDGDLYLLDPTPFVDAFGTKPDAEHFVGTEDYAKLHGVTTERVKSLLRTGRIPGAAKIGKRGFWIIPEDAPYPEDDRIIAGGQYRSGVHDLSWNDKPKY